MALMTTAARTVIFRTRDNQFEIYFRLDRLAEWLPKTGPTRSAVKLSIRRKQGQITSCTVIVTTAFFIIKGTCKRALRALVAQDVEGFRG